MHFLIGNTPSGLVLRVQIHSICELWFEQKCREVRNLTEGHVDIFEGIMTTTRGISAKSLRDGALFSTDVVAKELVMTASQRLSRLVQQKNGSRESHKLS